MSNVRCRLTVENSNPIMDGLLTRVIDGSQLTASTPENRREEAKIVYKRMMGIKATDKPISAEDTDDPVTVPPPVPMSDAVAHMKKQDQQALSQVAELISAGIAKGVAEALMARDRQEAKDQPGEASVALARKR